MYAIMSTVNKEIFTSFLTLLLSFIVLSKLFNTLLKRSGESGNPCLIPCFKGITQFCIINIELAISFSKVSFIRLSWAEEYSLTSIHMLKACPLGPQSVTVFGDWVFTEVIQLKWGFQSGP